MKIKAKFKKYDKISGKICLDCELNRQYIKKQSYQASNTYCLIVDKLWIKISNMARQNIALITLSLRHWF